MESVSATLIPAVSALVGTAIGGVITYLTTVRLKRQEWRQDMLSREIARRENLYSEFISEAGRLLLQSVQSKTSDPGEFQKLYSLQAKIRLHASDAVMDAAQDLTQAALHAHLKAKDEGDSSHSSSDGKRFSEAARADLAKLRKSAHS
jgi:hypothetical protein